MERQRSSSSSSSSYHLLSPKSLLLLSFASSSLLFSFLFALFALRHGRPLHLLPFASASLGANASAAAIARAPVLGASGGGAAVEAEEGVLGPGIGDSGEEGASRAVAGNLSARGVGLAMEAKEAAAGGGNARAPVSGEVLEGQEIAGAGSYSIGGLDSAIEMENEFVHGGGDGTKFVKYSVLEKTNSAEGKNLSKDGNASASQEKAATAEKPEGTVSVRAVNFSMEASGPAVWTNDGEFLQGGHLGESVSSSVQGAYASQHAGQLASSDYSTARNSSRSAPVHLNKQDPNLIDEAVVSKMDFPRSSAAHCDVYDGSWVFDESYPLYTSDSCPFIDEGFSCKANGRMDQSYMKRRWQPKQCKFPRCLLH